MNEVDNNIKNYLTVKEYSEKCNVSYQSIYKRLKNQDNILNNYVRYLNNQRMIHKKALEEVEGIVLNEVEESCTETANKVEQNANEVECNDEVNNQTTSSKMIIDLLNDRIKSQEKELENKNIQIATLQEQLSNSQKLLAMEKQEKQALLNSGEEEKQKESKSFFARLFFKK